VINLNVSTATRWGLNALILFIMILALYFGGPIFIPAILGLLLSAILWPVVTWLNKRGLPLPGLTRRDGFPYLRPCVWRLRLPWGIACLGAVSGVILVILIVAFSFGVSLGSFALDLGSPRNQEVLYGQFRDKVASMAPIIHDDDVFFNKDPSKSQIMTTLHSFFDPTKDTFLNMVMSLGYSGTQILWGVILILFILLFLLIEGKMLSRHLVSIFGPTESAQRRAVDALRDMATQIRSYIVWRTLINFGMGFFLGLLYHLIGLRQPWTWALLTAILWYVPYIGPIMAGFPPVLDAFISCPSPWAPVGILAFYVVFVVLEGYVVVPVLMGRSMELNATTVLLACVFWDLVWGVPGLFLAMPLMAAVRTICMHVPDWHPWANLMGTRANPPPPKHAKEPEVVINENFLEDTQILTASELKAHLASARPAEKAESGKEIA
jgi:predicted PurR-regulated permease PerM